MPRYLVSLLLAVCLTFVFTLSAQNQSASGSSLTQDTLLAKQLLDSAEVHIAARKSGEAWKLLEAVDTLLEKSGRKESTTYTRVLFLKGIYFQQRRNLDAAIENMKAGLELQIRISGEQHPDLAKFYDKLGLFYYIHNKSNLALEYYKKALPILLSTYGENDEHIALHYRQIGNIYNADHHRDSALIAYQKSLDILLLIYGENSIQVAKACFLMTDPCWYLTDYSCVIDYSTRVVNIYKALQIENDVILPNTYTILAGAVIETGDYEKGLPHLEKALQLYINLYGISNPYVVQTYLNIGLAYLQKDNIDLALEYNQKAVEVLMKNNSEENSQMAIAAKNIGEVYHTKGDYKNALTYYNKAINILTKYFPDDFYLLNQTYLSIGSLYIDMADYSLATSYLEKSLEYGRIVWGEAGEDIGDIYILLGNIFYKKNEYKQALLYHQKALDIYVKLLDEKNRRIASAYVSLSKDYDALGGQAQLAVEYQEKALRINRALFEEEHSQVANGYYNLGSIYLKNNQDSDRALEYHEMALNNYKSVRSEKHPEVARSYLALGDVHLKKRDYSTALANYGKALIANRFENNSYDGVLDLQVLVETFQKFGVLYLEQQKDELALVKARHYFREGLETIDTIRQTFVEGGSKQVLLQKNYAVYENLLKTDYLLFQRTDSLHYLQEAYQYANHAKSQLLNEGIRESDALRFAGLPDSLLDKEYNLRIDITYYEKRKQDLLNANKFETDSVVLAISNKLFDLKQTYENLKKNFETDYPDYYRLKYHQNAIAAKEVQKELVQPGQALLEYFVGDSSIFVFVLRPDTLIMYEVKKDFPLEEWVNQLREGLLGYHIASRKTDALYEKTVRQYTNMAYQLYQKLIAPLKKDLTPHLLIIPDGILGYVPFEALLSAAPKDIANPGTYPYLLRDHQISYCYSATLLREMQQKKKAKEPSGTLLAVAPFYSGDTTLLAGLFAYDETMRKDLAPLQHSGEEVYRISKLWKGDVLTGTDATETKFTERAGNYRILHLATHGRADERVGDYSFLAFSEIKDSVENELLYVRDLYNLQLNADLVVLSACETGLGKLSRGEGIISLARAFAYAGAKSVVTTLWSVNDARTKEVMVEFYRNLKKGLSKDAALRQAKLDYLKSHTSPVDAHPYYWAGFAPIGDMRALR